MVKEAKTTQRRRKILDAAARVFERDGLAKASMRAIAQEAGVTTGAIYPLFDGKEDLYAALLEESLVRLQSAVAIASAQESDALSALMAAAQAFFDYYAQHPFESSMGLYLYGYSPTQPKGVGEARDKKLNAQLLETLTIFEACFLRLAPTTLSQAEKQIWATRERDALFAALIGILLISFTGRTKSIGTDAQTVLQTYLNGLRDRIDNNVIKH